MKNYAEAVQRIVGDRGNEDAPISTVAVPLEEVEAAEKIIAKRFPDVLRDVWADIGGGFFRAPLEGGERLDAISCLMGPLDVAEIMRNRGWVGEKAVQYPFFNEDDEDFILLVESPDGFTVEHENGRGASLAADPKEFVFRLAQDPEFWIELLPSP